MIFDNIFLECSIGYFGKDCAKKCTYPVYGEDCQSICDCSKDSCHYSQGCLWNVENLSYQQLSKCLFGCTVEKTFNVNDLSVLVASKQHISLSVIFLQVQQRPIQRNFQPRCQPF